MERCERCGADLVDGTCAECAAWTAFADGDPAPAVPAWAPAPVEVGPTHPVMPPPPPPPSAGLAPGAAAPGWYPVDGRTQWWDGTGWSQAPLRPALTPYRSLAAWSWSLQVLVAASCVTAVVSIVTGERRLDLIQRVRTAPTTVTADELRASDDLAKLVGQGQRLLLLLVGISLLIWVHRVFKNLHGALAVSGLTYTPGWAVGWFFVPLANLWKVKQVMNEAWTASDPGEPAWNTRWTHAKASSLLSWWWAAWLVSSLWVSVGAGDRLDEIAAAIHRDVYRSVARIVAGVLLVLVVRGISARQAERATAVGALGLETVPAAPA